MEVVPERIRAAVAALDVAAGDRLLEIGCGPGVAISLVCERLGDRGAITAIDRSAVAVARALRRNASCVAAGRAGVHRAAFTAEDLAAAGLAGRTYDKVFSVNVNLFWTGPATAELALARASLAPGGRLYAFYEPPASRTSEIAGRVSAAFAAAGFAPTVTTDGVLCVCGT
jgi:SAM-dependent methyltransferase